jgi:hypothetical protein
MMDAPKAGALNHWDAGETLADRFRVHVGNAEHLYGYAVRGMAQDGRLAALFGWPVADTRMLPAAQRSIFGCSLACFGSC